MTSSDVINTLPIKNNINSNNIKDSNSNNPSNSNKDKISNNKYSGKEITTKCWNCDQTMLIQPDWKIIQCISCLKLNRIPGTGMFDDEVIPGKLTYKDKSKDIELEISVPIQVSHSIH